MLLLRCNVWDNNHFLSSSGVERSAVNRFVVGSNPTWGDKTTKYKSMFLISHTLTNPFVIIEKISESLFDSETFCLALRKPYKLSTLEPH